MRSEAKGRRRETITRHPVKYIRREDEVSYEYAVRLQLLLLVIVFSIRTYPGIYEVLYCTAVRTGIQQCVRRQHQVLQSCERMPPYD